MKKKAKNKVEDQTPDVVDETNAAEELEEQEVEETTDKTEQPKEPTVAEMQDKLLRMAAEYQNYQRRAQRQMEQASEFATERIIKNLLPVLDNFEHALEKGKDTGDIMSIMQGMQIVYDHMMDTLKTAGMKKILVEKGASFDPTKHEAMMHIEAEDVEANHVIMELSAGYEMNERTLRPAKVSIAKAKEEPAEADHNAENSEDKSEE